MRIERAGGWHQDGGRILYRGHVFPDGAVEEFDEDCRFSFTDASALSPRSLDDSQYAYNLDDINRFSAHLNIPWELSKDTAFAFITTYLGFEWDLQKLIVSVGPKKKVKYLLAIQEWDARPAHTLKEV